MLTEHIRELTTHIASTINLFLSEWGLPSSVASGTSQLLVGLLDVSLVLLVVFVPFLVLSFLVKLIRRYSNVN